MENSKIEWTDHTINSWIGCTKVSPGCQHCYAERQNSRYKWVWSFRDARKRTSEQNLNKPYTWNKQPWVQCPACGWRGPEAHWNTLGHCPDCSQVEAVPTQARVLCNSLSDILDDFHPEVLMHWRSRLFKTIADCSNLTWLLLTKRPENAERMFPEEWIVDGFPPHVWLGVSIESQKYLHRLAILSSLSVNRFVSVEPMLGPVSLKPYLWAVDWVICGGESGPKARPTYPHWIQGLRDECEGFSLPFFFKQWGEWAPADELKAKHAHEVLWVRGREECGYYCDEEHGHVDHQEWLMERVGRKAAGAMLDGKLHRAFPVFLGDV